jgi:SAM-dependent methyltransferase
MNPIQRLEELLYARSASWERLSIREVYHAEYLPEPQPQLTEHLFSRRAEVLRWLQTRDEQQPPTSFSETPASFLAQKTQEWLQRQNQFLTLGASARSALQQLYERSLVSATEALTQSRSAEALQPRLDDLFASHHEGFVDFLTALDRAEPRAGFIFQRAICAEYSATLQRSILGLEAPLLGPILDVGCGASAGLVIELRRLGFEAFGIDRFAAPGPYTQCLDWFEYPFLPDTWGTILSHLAFSHHFMHHHLKGSPDAERYAQQYLKILRALVPGGVFCYAPSLPFFEALLPADVYLVTHKPIEGQRLYTCAVQRRYPEAS